MSCPATHTGKLEVRILNGTMKKVSFKLGEEKKRIT